MKNEVTPEDMKLLDYINRIRFDSDYFSLLRLMTESEPPHHRYVMRAERETGNIAFYRYDQHNDQITEEAEKFLEIDAQSRDLNLYLGGEKISLSKSQPPVGSIMQSFLPLNKFQEIYGKNWVLCDGADCKNTRFSELTGLNKLPDSSGKFLRSAGGKAANLGESQGEATAVNGLSNASSVVTGGTFGGTVTEHDPINTDSKTHTHNLDFYHYSWGDNRGGNGADYGARENSSVVGDKSKGKWDGSIKDSGSHSHTIPTHSHGFTGSISGKRTAAAQAIRSTDTETRPENITVNTFVRIN